MSDRWAIHIAADKLNTEKFDKFVFGKSRAHSFLLLVDEGEQSISREIHGTFHNLGNRKMGPTQCPSKKADLIHSITSSFGLHHTFMACAKSFKLDKNVIRLGVKEIKSTRELENVTSYPIVSGTKQQMQNMWKEGRKKESFINNKKPTFIPFNLVSGQNCHSATSTILDHLGLSFIPEKFPEYTFRGFDNIITKQSI